MSDNNFCSAASHGSWHQFKAGLPCATEEICSLCGWVRARRPHEHNWSICTITGLNKIEVLQWCLYCGKEKSEDAK